MSEMMKAIFITTLCVLLLPATLVCEGRRLKVSRLPMILRGRVYCDTCRAGFENDATTYMPDAKVRVECRNQETQNILFSKEGMTDSTGTYRIVVKEDLVNQLCDVKLISSSQHDCASPDPGRDRSRVNLNTYNGITSQHRVANSLRFLRDQALSGCDKLLEKYLQHNDD